MFILGMFLEVVILKVWLFFNMVVVFDVVIFGYVVVNKELLVMVVLMIYD